jgi:hypothetical protein
MRVGGDEHGRLSRSGVTRLQSKFRSRLSVSELAISHKLSLRLNYFRIADHSDSIEERDSVSRKAALSGRIMIFASTCEDRAGIDS